MIYNVIEINKTTNRVIKHNLNPDGDWTLERVTNYANKIRGIVYEGEIPESKTLKMENGIVVIDEESKTKEEIKVEVKKAKLYLKDTDFKMALDYDQDVTDVKLKRQEAREFIRANETLI